VSVEGELIRERDDWRKRLHVIVNVRDDPLKE
jgi:hypothetical protein